ncbi:hypothetical protein LJC08_03345 [Methanimicrococcus sp. OttesenSCG-928-J09]|nr:hypothetical protein [Methanimicrococcus sp. OttesenSCG-928-J09]
MNSFVLILLLLITAFIVWLEIKLSRDERAWPGLILPAFTFCMSLLIVLGIAMYTATPTGVTVFSECGEVISSVQTAAMESDGPVSLLILIAVIFPISNIPTVILLGIYAIFRNKRKNQSALEKMRIQDLE